jgi:PhnB protein
MSLPMVKPIPDGTRTITAHIVVRDAARAAAWYVRVFGAEERGRIPVPGGKFLEIELRIGDSTLMIADEFPEMGVLSPLAFGGTYLALHIATDDVDALWQRAMDGGATVFQPLGDTFWGERHGQIIDPFGHRWGFNQHIRDVPREEIIRAAADLFSG